jgi:hypothetical protein
MSDFVEVAAAVKRWKAGEGEEPRRDPSAVRRFGGSASSPQASSFDRAPSASSGQVRAGPARLRGVARGKHSRNQNPDFYIDRQDVQDKLSEIP